MPHAAVMRPVPVTPWRASLAGLADAIVKTILQNEDPERQFQTARETSEDIRHAIQMQLKERHGRVFDPIWDGPADEPRGRGRPAHPAYGD